MTTTNPSSPTQPTPDELAEQMRTFDGTAPDVDDRMKRIVHDAEAGGSAHMEAVVDALFKRPDGAPSHAVAAATSVYDMATGRPAFHESNVLLELYVRINGRSFVAREAIDPFEFGMRFGDEAGFEKFIGHFVRASCGRLVADAEGYRYLREAVWIVYPGDLHDFKRCADGWGTGPYCDTGLISKAPRISPVLTTAEAVFEAPTRRDDVLGVCPCRCHRYDGSWHHVESLVRVYGMPVFCEEMLDQVEA